MVTGLEPLLGPAVAKAAGAGAARIAGWGAKEVLASLRRRKIRALTHSRARAAQLDALSALSTEQMDQVQAFCQSLEMEHIATSLSRAYLLEGAGKKTDTFTKNVKDEFLAAFNSRVSGNLDPLVANAIYAAISESVSQTIAPLLSRPKLAPSLEAELIATAGSLSAASVRNTELIQNLRDIDELKSFEAEYKSQAAAIHATMRLPHAGTTRQVPYKDLFVQPRILVESDEAESRGKVATMAHIDEIMGHTPRLVILGDPGGGKSTLSRKFTADLAADRLPDLRGRVPFYLELREYATVVRGRNRRTLVEQIEETCKSPYNIEAPENAIEYMLLNDKAVVILDGLDELLDVSLRRYVVEAVEGFAHRFPTCPMLVTSRRIGYSEAALNEDLFTRASLEGFNYLQVADYVNKWFTLDENIEEARQGQLARSFLSDSQFVADLRVNPLMLSLMCGIYASESYIPRNRPDVYEKCALLLFESWDKQRGIVPELSFDAHVQSALRALALHIFNQEASGSTEAGQESSPTSEGIPRSELIRFFSSYLRKKRFDNDEDAETAAVEFLEFCKGRAWVLTDVGAETYGFTHRTFLEYFAASQLVRLNTSAKELYGELKPKVRAGESDVVAQLAVQILGRTAEDGADDFLELLVEDSEGAGTQERNALSFAARALNFVVPRPQVLKKICSHAVRLRFERRDEDGLIRGDAVDELFGCSLENAPRVASAIREALNAAFGENTVSDESLALAFLPRAFGSGSHARWNDWRRENWDIYSELREKSRANFYWLAVMEYEAGEITFNELMALHGTKSLYDFRIGRSGDYPPFIYRYIRYQQRGGYQGIAGGHISQSRTKAIADDLLGTLPTRPVPWLTQCEDYDQTASALDRLDRDTKGGRPARILLSLPLLEMSDGGNRQSLFVGADELYAARTTGSPLSEEFLSMFDKYPSAQELLTKWVSGETNLMRRRRSRSAKKPERQSRARG